MVLGWETKGFSPAFPHARLEVGVVQLAAKSLDHGPQGTSSQPTSSQGARNNLHMQQTQLHASSCACENPAQTTKFFLLPAC